MSKEERETEASGSTENYVDQENGSEVDEEHGSGQGERVCSMIVCTSCKEHTLCDKEGNVSHVSWCKVKISKTSSISSWSRSVSSVRKNICKTLNFWKFYASSKCMNVSWIKPRPDTRLTSLVESAMSCHWENARNVLIVIDSSPKCKTLIF